MARLLCVWTNKQSNRNHVAALHQLKPPPKTVTLHQFVYPPCAPHYIIFSLSLRTTAVHQFVYPHHTAAVHQFVCPLCPRQECCYLKLSLYLIFFLSIFKQTASWLLDTTLTTNISPECYLKLCHVVKWIFCGLSVGFAQSPCRLRHSVVINEAVSYNIIIFWWCWVLMSYCKAKTSFVHYWRGHCPNIYWSSGPCVAPIASFTVTRPSFSPSKFGCFLAQFTKQQNPEFQGGGEFYSLNIFKEHKQ